MHNYNHWLFGNRPFFLQYRIYFLPHSVIRSHIKSQKEVISKHSTEIVLLKHVKMFSFVGRLKMLLITSEDVSFSNALFSGMRLLIC